MQIGGGDYRERGVPGSEEHHVSVVEVSGSGRFPKDFSGIPGFLPEKVNKLDLPSLEYKKGGCKRKLDEVQAILK